MPQKQAKDAATVKEIADIRKQISSFARNANPGIAETVTLQVTLAADAELGVREIRLGTPLGLSNPRLFGVGQLPEVSRPTASKASEPLNFRDFRPGNDPRRSTPQPDLNITLPAMVNGQIMPSGVDRYRFQASQGQRLVVAVAARELIPYLPDAVPGWFQAALALYDTNGKELAFADHYRFHPDPVLYYEIPRDGEYAIAIRDDLYRGREDFVYRISLGEIPFVTSIFPIGGRDGAATIVELKGWNLPTDRLTRQAESQGIGLHPLSVRKAQGVSNLAPFAVDTLPESLEQEPNNQPDHAQPVTLPVIINGRIDQPGDRDVFCFEGRADQEIVAEVVARRLNSPLDSVLKLTDAAGKQWALNDDQEDKGAGLTTHHADSRLYVTLPADGTYYVHLNDVQNKGGAEYAYRLRISPPRPDFELRVVPSSVNARAGMTVPVTVYALRRDGFSEGIALALKDAPAGFTLHGGWVPARQDQVRLTLTVPSTRREEPLQLHLEGRAVLQGQELSRPAIPADDMTQAFAYHHLVPARDWLVAVSGSGWNRPPMKLLGEQPLKLPAGGTAEVRCFVPGGPQLDQVQLNLSEPPAGIVLQKVSPGREGLAILLSADAEKVQPGLQGNLIIEAFLERAVDTPDGKRRGDKRRVPLGTLPAIRFEIVGPSAAEKSQE